MNIYEQLMRDEAIRYSAYQDAEGYWTIGVGHCIDARKGCGISHDIALQILQQDVLHWTAQIAETWPWTQALDEVRRAVLVNMAHNLGIGGLSQFVMFLGALEQGHWEDAAQEMLNSKWAQQVGARAERLAEQVRSGLWV